MGVAGVKTWSGEKLAEGSAAVRSGPKAEAGEADHSVDNEKQSAAGHALVLRPVDWPVIALESDLRNSSSGDRLLKWIAGATYMLHIFMSALACSTVSL